MVMHFCLHSIPGSAVCAFSMADIEKVFWGRFKEQKTQDSVWTPFSEEKLPKPRYKALSLFNGKQVALASAAGYLLHRFHFVNPCLSQLNPLKPYFFAPVEDSFKPCPCTPFTICL